MAHHEENGPVFYVNITATGKDIHGQITRQYMREQNGMANPPAELVEKHGGWGFFSFSGLKQRAVNMTANVTSSLGGHGTSCRYFETLAEIAASRAMSHFMFFCKAKTIFVASEDTKSGKEGPKLFAVVRIHDITVPTSERGFCHSAIQLPIPACCFWPCFCCKHHFFHNFCCGLFRPALNVEAVAGQVKKILDEDNKEEGGTAYTFTCVAEIDHEERIFLNTQGYYTVNLDVADDEEEGDAQQPLMGGEHGEPGEEPPPPQGR